MLPETVMNASNEERRVCFGALRVLTLARRVRYRARAFHALQANQQFLTRGSNSPRFLDGSTMIVMQTKTTPINAHHAHSLKTLQEVEHSRLFPVLTLRWPFYGKFPTAFMALSRHFLEAFPFLPECFKVFFCFLLPLSVRALMNLSGVPPEHGMEAHKSTTG